MAGFLSQGSWKTHSFTCNEDNGVKNGQFVTVDFTTGNANLATTANGDGAGLYFVMNEIDTIPEELIDDDAYVIKKGKFVRVHDLIAGDVFVTTLFTGNPSKGDQLAVSDGGVLAAIAARTPAHSFRVESLDTAYGLPAIKVIVEK